MRLMRLAIWRTHGYMDPGSGSLLVQILLGGAAGLAVMVRLMWHRIGSVLGIAKKDHEEQGPESA